MVVDKAHVIYLLSGIELLDKYNINHTSTAVAWQFGKTKNAVWIDNQQLLEEYTNTNQKYLKHFLATKAIKFIKDALSAVSYLNGTKNNEDEEYFSINYTGAMVDTINNMLTDLTNDGRVLFDTVITDNDRTNMAGLTRINGLCTEISDFISTTKAYAYLQHQEDGIRKFDRRDECVAEYENGMDTKYVNETLKDKAMRMTMEAISVIEKKLANNFVVSFDTKVWASILRLLLLASYVRTVEYQYSFDFLRSHAPNDRKLFFQLPSHEPEFILGYNADTSMPYKNKVQTLSQVTYADTLVYSNPPYQHFAALSTIFREIERRNRERSL